MSSANPPIIVHCSAGIGRTGVLILMDTALALMEAREPVYPLDIVQTMRDQRACMVQNVVSNQRGTGDVRDSSSLINYPCTLILYYRVNTDSCASASVPPTHR